jgi:effector-binding domain-containing protein
MEVGVEVDRGFEQVDAVVASELPAGRVATATHSTGYGDLHVTYAAIKEWCEANDHVVTGDTWEIYGDPDDGDQVDVEVYYLLV